MKLSNSRLLAKESNVGLLIALLLTVLTLLQPYSITVKSWIILGFASCLIVYSTPRPLKGWKLFHFCSLACIFFVFGQLGYNLSIRETSSDTYAAILQTFGYEALWFSANHGELSRSISIIFIMAAVSLVLDRALSRRSYSSNLPSFYAGLFLVCLAGVGLIPGFHTEANKIGAAVKQLNNEKMLFKQTAPAFLEASLLTVGHRKLSVVVIVGEATSRWNTSLYGYPRRTFSPLEKIRDLIIFDDVVAPHTHTVPSLNLALTSAEFSPSIRPRVKRDRAYQLIADQGFNLSSTLSNFGCFLKSGSEQKACNTRTTQRHNAQLINASDLFDPAWYLNAYEDALKAWQKGLTPAEHYLQQGGPKGYDPSPGFSTQAYLRKYPDVALSGMNPLLHYLKFGIGEGRTIEQSQKESYYKDKQDLPMVPLVGALNAAGIKTYWFSNQNEYGLWENPISHHGKMATVSYFHRKSVGTRFEPGYWDGDLVSVALQKVKNLHPRSAMFLHFYASHGPYCGVVPKPVQWDGDLLSSLPPVAIFGKFTDVDKKRLNCYDAAIHYVAENIKRVVDWINLHDQPVILVYFSDHGDDAFSGKGHDSAGFTHKMAEVPLIIYFNEAAKAEYSSIFDTLTDHTAAPINVENIFDLILDLFAIRLHKHSTAERSIASSDFKPKSRFILDRGSTGYISYDALPTIPSDLADGYVAQKRQLQLLDRSLRNKVCAHRNNSLLKYLEAISLFECIEIDIILSNGAAMVHHDEDDPNGLPLEVLLALPRSSSTRLWLDVKNLSDSNVTILLNLLKRFDRDANNTLVEVSATMAGSRSVAMLRQAGHTVSYYLPTDLAKKCSNQDDSSECTAFRSKVEWDLRSGFNSLSFDAKVSRFVSTLKIPEHVSLSTWDLRASISDVSTRPDLNRYNMFIVPFASDYHH